jgi:hypothetical protein
MPLLLLLLIGGGLFLATRKAAHAPAPMLAGPHVLPGQTYQLQVLDATNNPDPTAITASLNVGGWQVLTPPFFDVANVSGTPASAGGGTGTVWNISAATWQGPATALGAPPALVPGTTNLLIVSIHGSGI